MGNNDIDQTLKATSDLLSLRSSAPVSPFGLIARARSDTDRLKTALESFGYYESHVTITINGLPLTDPSLGDALTALAKGSSARVAISFALGTLYHLRRIDIDGEVPPPINARETLGLSSGQPAVAANVLAGGARLLSALQEQGYAFAQVDAPIAYEAADAPVLDLSFHVAAGLKVKIGDIHVEGLQRVHESLVRRRLLLHSGDLYKPSAIEAARRDLLGMNVFGQVSVQVGSKADESGGVPITFKLRERLRHAISVLAAYSSDLGGSGGVTWTDRNVFGNAEQLSFAASRDQPWRQRHDGNRLRHQREVFDSRFSASRSVAAVRGQRDQAAAAGIRSKSANRQCHLEPQAFQRLDGERGPLDHGRDDHAGDQRH